mmetsp:Transcript_131628/g.281458  ORF Transcript_131628/g.281458 Transcript_131628/m.281458 type:complete len:188 (-) Transcript_131628:99-662(-)
MGQLAAIAERPQACREHSCCEGVASTTAQAYLLTHCRTNLACCCVEDVDVRIPEQASFIAVQPVLPEVSRTEEEYLKEVDKVRALLQRRGALLARTAPTRGASDLEPLSPASSDGWSSCESSSSSEPAALVRQAPVRMRPRPPGVPRLNLSPVSMDESPEQAGASKAQQGGGRCGATTKRAARAGGA